MRTTLVVVLALGTMLPLGATAQTVLDNATGNTTGSLAPNTTGSLSSSGALSQATTGTTGSMTTGTTGTTTQAATPTAVAPAAVPPRDAAIVICAQDFSTGAGRLIVFNSSTSAGAPTVPPGLACAQALSDLFVAGFSVIDVLAFNQQQLQYTLVR